MKTVYTEWDDQVRRSTQRSDAEQVVVLQRKRSQPEVKIDRHQYLCYRVSDLQNSNDASKPEASS
jgi:hypothetical protein